MALSCSLLLFALVVVFSYLCCSPLYVCMYIFHSSFLFSFSHEENVVNIYIYFQCLCVEFALCDDDDDEGGGVYVLCSFAFFLLAWNQILMVCVFFLYSNVCVPFFCQVIAIHVVDQHYCRSLKPLKPKK